MLGDDRLTYVSQRSWSSQDHDGLKSESSKIEDLHCDSDRGEYSRC
jgi:hypothetical protein